MKLTKEQVEDAIKMASTPDLPNFSKAGTGKTHTALRAIEIMDTKQNLILCPKIAVAWWEEQAREFLGAETNVLTSGDSKIGGDITITTFDIARNARSRIYETFKGGTLTLDESHYVRNPEAKRTQAVFGNLADGFGGFVEKFDTVWPMSGTPIEAYANDMWTQVGTLHPEIWDKYGIQTYEQFCTAFTYKTKKQFHPQMQPVWKISGNTNEGLLHRIVYEEIGAIRRQTAKGLPRLRMRKLHVPVRLTREVRSAMAGLSAEEIVKKITGDNEDEILAKIWKIIGLAKVPELVPYCGDLSKEGPVLIGCWHKDVMKAYKAEFVKMGKVVEIVDGSTPDKKRDKIRLDFNAGRIDILLGQMRAMGVSWNIQESCSYVVIAETYPAPSIIEQFYKRVYRFGQKKEVNVDIVLSTTPVDEALDAVRMRKEASDAKINK